MDAHSLDRLDFPRIRELLAGYALTGLGRQLAGAIQPVGRVTLVRRWLAQVEELQRLIEERGMPPFGGISDIREILLRSGPPLRVTVEEMAAVGRALAGTHELASYLRDLPAERPELAHLAARVGDFRTVAERIGAVIDERGQVRDNASPKLAELRREISAATLQIDDTIARLLGDAGVRRLLQYPNHTFHGDRLVLPLRTECRGRLPGIVHRTSDSGATLYVEPAAVVELNNRISNLKSEEQEEIGRLLWDLTHEVHLNSREIHKTIDTLAVLDLIVAKVRFARDFELHCPVLGAEGTLKVRNARHPLLIDLARRKQATGQPVGEIVPIDYRLGHDFALLIITGPNTGGKTVTLKTIGLLSLMVQAGLPVPAARDSEFGVFSTVLIDVGDEQSLQQSLSTFSAHITRVIEMLKHAGPHALLLIDELGAGTDPDEGAALGRAILDEILRLHSRGVVTTHLGALKGFAVTREGAENACVEFDTETLRPTYRLALGEPGQSNAIAVAERLGMSRRMVIAARSNVSRKTRVLHQAIEGTRVVKRQAEDARREAEQARLDAGKAASAAAAARQQFEQRQQDFEKWLAHVVHLQPGDAVRVRDFDRDGKVVRVRLDQQRAEIDVGAFSVEVPLGDLLPPQTPAPPPPPPRPLYPTSPPRPPRRPAAERRGPDGKPLPGGPPGAGRPPADAQRAGAAPGAPHGPRSDTPRPPPNYPSLTAEQASKLQPLDTVYVRRFHREGRVVRVNAARQLVIVNVGVLELEVPFDGLAQPPKREPRPAPPKKPRPAGTPGGAPASDAPPVAPPPVPSAPEATAPADDDPAPASPPAAE
jgi:DNA mismatch repair protein MutS2